MKFKSLLTVLCLSLSSLFTGCQSPSSVGQVVNEANARKAADYVSKHAGFLEYGVMVLVQREISNLPEGTDKAKIIAQVNVGAANLAKLFEAGNFDADAVTNSLKIEGNYVTPGMALVAQMLTDEIVQAKKNGYVDLLASIAPAVLKGIADGTAQ